MPVKVRCGECEQSFNVPDKVRGKTIACPKCSGKIKVPGEDAAPAKAPAKAKKPKDDADFLSYGDLEDQDESICPFCAKPVDMEEDDICPSCGRDLVTGEMDKKQAKKRSKAGKSTAYFYKNFIRECWEFTKEFKALAIRTGMYNLLFTLLFFGCMFMAKDYCEKTPPRVFWIAMTAVTFLGIPGWFWFLSRKIVSSELYGEKLESDRIHFDFFAVVALGLGLILWPWLLGLPLTYMLAGTALFQKLGYLDQEQLKTAAIAVNGVLSLASSFVYPIATIHVVARHNHKAWILYDMFRISFKNFGAVMIYHLTAIVLSVLFVVAAVAVQLVAGGILLFNNPHLLGWAHRLVTWLLDTMGSSDPNGEGFFYALLKIGVMYTFAAIALAPLYIMAGFPTIFMMRLNALIAKHFQHSLELDQQIKPATPASPWVRFLAATTDLVCFPFACILAAQKANMTKLAWALNGIMCLVGLGYFMGWFGAAMVIPLASFWVIFMHWMYNCIPVSNPGKATMGMEAFGLIAMRDNPNLKPKELEKELTVQEASIRWVGILLFGYVPLGILGLIGLVRPDHKLIQDLMSKTKTVFKGDR